ncbi:hypothetical protein F5Y16DRAFT_389091 [Xylariaceae sp. FL0255]|nr:hypothetical protein F5Y16DRAFT_389091 [Xylariaceae sp. FL0255]
MSSPPRRRSARIASSSKRIKASPVPQLSSLTEFDEQPIKERPSQFLTAIMSSPIPAPHTPSALPVKAPMSEMHPSRVHQTTAPPSSALRHGFTDIDYTAPPVLADKTPSKTPASTFDFTFSVRPNGESKLGPEAQKMMEELRGQAAMIKAQLTAERERERAERGESDDGRKIAAAKGKAGRYSAAHLAEFKKMDSIEGHASAFRAAPGRFNPLKAITPLKPGIKRSQSKANLEEPDSARGFKMTSTTRVPVKFGDESSKALEGPSKRTRHRIEDDTSTLRPVSREGKPTIRPVSRDGFSAIPTIRPVSRDGSSIPRPKSSGNDSIHSGIPRSQTLTNLSTPTKASLARSNSIKTPTIVKSPSKPELGSVSSFSAKVDSSIIRSPSIIRTPSKKVFGSLKKSATISNLDASRNIPTHVQTPGRFDRVKSILKRQFSGDKAQSSTTNSTLTASKTPYQDKTLPPVPLTTPGRKHDRHVAFTPDTKRAVVAQNSPSPVKSSIPRATTMSAIPAPKSTLSDSTYGQHKDGDVAYPDLSAYEAKESKTLPPAPPSIAGTFTFRSDHTIQFDSSPSKGFGSHLGQSSVRQVRDSSIPPVRMPGGFPRTSEVLSPIMSSNKENDDPLLVPGIKHGLSNKKRHVAGEESPTMSSNKENDDPVLVPGIKHGLSNKKRHRAGEDDEDEDEGAKRGMKKIRQEAPEGHAVVAPRLVSATSPAKKTPVRPIATPGSQKKKKAGLSLSRLNMLARPKVRN